MSTKQMTTHSAVGDVRVRPSLQLPLRISPALQPAMASATGRR